jgi:hypothetical protein
MAWKDSGMTNTPEHAAAAAAVNAVDELEDLRQLSGLIAGLMTTLLNRAARGDAPAVAKCAEQLLPLHAEFARVYRTWLAHRVTGTMFTLGCDGDRPSV